MENQEDKEKEETPNEIKEEPKNTEEKSKDISTYTDKMRENPWIVSTIVLVILGLILLISNFGGVHGGVITGNVVSELDAGESMINWVNTQTDGKGELVEIEPFSDMFYRVTIDYEGDEISLYVTKDGKYFTAALTSLEDLESLSSTSTEVPKSDKPVAELFVMTHCPYGTQAEKGFIPIIKALGDSIDAKIRFVHYFMHEPEETETPIQVCIREEQPDKFLDYLECFLEDGDSDRCLTEADIDESELNACISGGKADEYYEEDSELSESYGVMGSPTLIVNGVEAQSGRSPAAYLATICSAFNNVPEECNLELSDTTPSPMWGYEEGEETTAQC